MFRLISLYLLLFLFRQSGLAQSCKALTYDDFPAEDRPTAAEAERLEGKAAYRFYYGIGTPVDYVKARKAAFAEWEVWRLDHDPYSGVDILMMIYANGYGVKRNLDLGIRVACGNVGGAEPEFTERIKHLLRMKDGDSTGVFDLADDVTSSYMLGWRASLLAEQDSARRVPILDSLLARWPRTVLPAYKAARQAATAFFASRLENEVETSGDLHEVLVIGESDSLEKRFLTQLLRFNGCPGETLPGSATRPADSSDAEKELGVIFFRRMQEQDDRRSSIKKKKIRVTQKKWTDYRDSMVSLHQQICPGISAGAAKDMLTAERKEELLQLLQAL